MSYELERFREAVLDRLASQAMPGATRRELEAITHQLLTSTARLQAGRRVNERGIDNLAHLVRRANDIIAASPFYEPEARALVQAYALLVVSEVDSFRRPF